jgi:uridine kinase
MDKLSPYIVGITGGSASGKTSFLRDLQHGFTSEEVCLISFDNYYKPLAQIPLDQEGQPNFDEPEALDIEAMVKDLNILRSGGSYERKEYIFNNEKAVAQMYRHYPAKIIIVEGLFIFSEPEIAKNLNLKIFVEAHDEARWERRKTRDKAERNIPDDIILYQWHKHVEPSFQKYLAPYRALADIIILNNTSYDLGLQLVKDHFKQYLSRNK